MTPQEAVKWLKAIEEKYIHGGDEDFDEKRKIAINIAISALEKQMPKKPIKTDNEIVKALECCISKWTCDTNCPMWSVQHCGFELRKDALDLINRQNEIIDRQKDQIELLEIEKQALRGAANSYKAEIESKNDLIHRQSLVKEMVGAENGEEIKPTELH